jgi:hypothetical protein
LSTSNAAVPSKVGNLADSVAVSVVVATQGNNLSDQASAHHPVLASKAAASEVALAVVVEDLGAAFVATEEVALAIGEDPVVTEEVDLAIEDSVAEVVLGIKEAEDLEDVVGMLMELPRRTHQVGRAADAVDMEANPTALLNLTTVIVAATGMVIAMAIGVVARAEVHGMTAETREAVVEVIVNLLPVGTEDMVEIETGTVNVTGMAVAAAAADETTTTDRENDTTKVMDMMTPEAKEGIESRLHRLNFFSINKNSTVCWWVPTSFDFSPPFSYFSLEGKKGIGSKNHGFRLGFPVSAF